MPQGLIDNAALIRYNNFMSATVPEIIKKRHAKAASDPVGLDLCIQSDGDTPLHVQVRNGLRARIIERYAPGDPFYSEQALERCLPVSKITIRRALDDLGREGLLIRQRGRTTRVGAIRERALVEASPEAAQPSSAPVARTSPRFKAVGVCVPAFVPGYVSQEIDAISRACSILGVASVYLHITDAESASTAFANLPYGPDEMAFVLFCNTETTTFLYFALRGRGYRAVAIDRLPLICHAHS